MTPESIGLSFLLASSPVAQPSIILIISHEYLVMFQGALLMPLLNYTTRVSVEKTVGEIQKCLAAHGAQAILSEDDAKGNVIALSFKVRVGQQDLAFRLPSDWRPVLKVLEQHRREPKSLRTKEQALRVSWRIIKDWVEAQMAIIDTKMVQIEQVFLPYAIMSDGRTLYERVRDARFVLPHAETKEI
jgi:hypothetical protein